MILSRRPSPSAPPRPPKGRSAPDYAREYKVDVRTIRTWKKKGYNLDDPAAVKAALQDQHKAPAHLVDPPTGGTSKERRENIQVEILKFRLEKDKGLHIPIDAVKADGAKIGAVLAATFESLPSELVSILEGKTPGAMHKILTERFRQIRIDIAKMADATPEIPE